MPLINFSGLASGIDSGALIEALLDQQRKARIDPLERQISELQGTNGAFEELGTLTSALNDAAQTFRAINGGALEKNANSSDESIMNASASSSAAPGTYNVTVNQLAKNATFSFDDRGFGAGDILDAGINDVAPAVDRTVSFDIGTGASAETVDVVMTSTMTMGEFVEDFNSNSDKATASLVSTGAGGSAYAIVITSNSEGTEDGTITLNSIGPEISVFATNTLDQATNADITIDGVAGSITRSSNVINDVIPDLTLDLRKTGSATITVGVDEERTSEHVQTFVDAYNDLVEYLDDNNLIERVDGDKGSEILFGPLASSRVDDNLLSSIRSAFSNSGTVGQTVNILADLGITTERDGTLAFDSDMLKEALNDVPNDVKTILESLGENLGAVDGILSKFTRFKGLFELAIDGNNSLIESYQDRILLVEDSLSEQQNNLNQRFARLESSVSRMQSQQSALSGLLAGLA